MNRISFCLCSLLCAAGLVSAQARFEVAGGLERTYPKVPLGTFVLDTLTILNPGSAVLHLISIKPTCGCTAVIVDTNAIAPGGKAHVYVKIDPPDILGRVHKTIQFLTNDLAHPRQEVGFGFEVLRDLGAEPRHFAFAGCMIHKPCVTAVTLHNVSDSVMRLFRQPITVPGLRCLMPDTVAMPPHSTLPYRLQLTPDTTGYLVGRFLLRTTSRLNPQLDFSVAANVADTNGVAPMPKR